jgi:hypothetical protein
MAYRYVITNAIPTPETGRGHPSEREALGNALNRAHRLAGLRVPIALTALRVRIERGVPGVGHWKRVSSYTIPLGPIPSIANLPKPRRYRP